MDEDETKFVKSKINLQTISSENKEINKSFVENFNFENNIVKIEQLSDNEKKIVKYEYFQTPSSNQNISENAVPVKYINTNLYTCNTCIKTFTESAD